MRLMTIGKAVENARSGVSRTTALVLPQGCHRDDLHVVDIAKVTETDAVIIAHIGHVVIAAGVAVAVAVAAQARAVIATNRIAFQLSLRKRNPMATTSPLPR